MLTIVISLDRAKARFDRLSRRLAASGIEFERLSAVEGRSVPSSLAPQFERSSHLLDGEVGCYASHLLAYDRLLASGEAYALVLEDDVAFSLEPSVFHEIAQAAPTGWDIIKLSSWGKFGTLPIAKTSSGLEIVAYPRIPMHTGAQLVSRAGAMKMLRQRLRAQPIDVDMARPWEYGGVVCGVIRPLALQVKADTFIGGDRAPGHIYKLSSLYMRTVHNFRTFGFGRGLKLMALGVRNTLFGSGYRRQLRQVRKDFEREFVAAEKHLHT